MTIKIGTRGSKLALWQAHYVADRLKLGGWETEIVIIETTGDKIQDRSLSKIGSKGVFTEELEAQLSSGAIHLAVHSAKDMQADLPEHLPIIAFTERERENDVVVSHHPDFRMEDSPGITIGTSSVRRVAFLRHFYPKIKIVDMRGNLQTRIAKMERGDCDALLLAFAGVHRMGYNHLIHKHLPIDQFTPPTGQGSVAIQAATNSPEALVKAVKQWVGHPPTEVLLRAERAYLKTLKGGCSIPAFANATATANGLHVVAGLIHPAGQPLLRFEASGTEHSPEEIGDALAKKVLTNGGREILDEIRAGAK